MKLAERLFARYRTQPLPEDFFQGAVDVHSHVLPGVDDGIRSVHEACEVLQAYEAVGMAGVIFTPHFMSEYSDNRRPAIEERFMNFSQHWHDLSPASPLKLHLAAEYMVDDGFTSHLKDGLLMLNDRSASILVETSYLAAHPDFEAMLYEASLEGYRPVIAHPERYAYASEQTYAGWLRKGYRFQLNLMSLAGTYGEEAQDKASHFLEEGRYSFVGTDLHHLGVWKQSMAELKLTAKQIDAVHALFENNVTLLR